MLLLVVIHSFLAIELISIYNTKSKVKIFGHLYLNHELSSVHPKMDIKHDSCVGGDKEHALKVPFKKNSKKFLKEKIKKPKDPPKKSNDD